MAKPRQNIIAIVYDFDGTLSPNNMQEDTIFRAYGIDKEKFWRKVTALVEKEGYERILAYLKLLIHDEIFKDKPIKRNGLVQLAKKIEYYPGVETYFDGIERFIEEIPEVKRWEIKLEHYIISSGMKEILEGSEIYRRFKRVYACEYEWSAAGEPVFPKLVINDTNKTQFLFRINKGKLELAEDINTHMPEEEKRIPFRNIIYVGDSETDIPSMTVVQKYGGSAIAVFNEKIETGVEKIRHLVKEKRADHFAPANFTENALLVRILQCTLKKNIYNIAYLLSSDMSHEWMKQHT